MKHPAIFILLLLALLAPAQVLATRTVRVGIYQFAPLAYTGPQGMPHGMYVDILGSIAAEEHWRLKYVPGTWEQCLQRLGNGSIDILLGIAYSPERTKRYNFNHQTLVYSWGELYTKPGKHLEKVEDLAGRKVAVLKGDLCYTDFKRLVTGLKVPVRYIECDEYGQVFALVKEGKAAAAVVERLHAGRYRQRFNLERSPIIFSTHELRFGFAKGGDPGLARAVDKWLERWKRDPFSPYQRSLDRWISGQTTLIVPQWIYWSLAWVGGMLLVALISAEVLRRKVNRKTAQLAAKNQDLQDGLSRLAQAEDALRASEEQYRTMVNNLEVGIYRSTGRNLGHFLQVNPAMARMLGFDSVDELMAEPISRIYVDPADRKRLLSDLSRDGVVEGRDILLRRQDGSQLWARCTAAANLNEKGGLRWVDGVLIDITERRRAEMALRESEERYRALTDHSLTGVYIHRGGRFLYANQRLADILGRPLLELLERPFWEMVHPLDREIVRRRGQARARGAQVDTSHYVFRAIRKDGQTRWLEIMAASVPLADGTANMGNVVDITDRLLAEQALAESEARYRQLVEQAPAGIYEIDITGDHFVSVNDVMCRMTDYSKEELLRMSPSDLLTEPSRLLFARRVEQANAGEPIPETTELEIVRKDGGAVWLLLHTSFIFEDGAPVRARVVAHNVTDRKLVETALIESEERYRRLVEEVPYGLFICEATTGSFLFVNKVACELFGYTRDEVMNQNIWRVTDPREHEVIKKRISQRLAGVELTGANYYTGRCKDGSFIRCEVVVSPVHYQGRTAMQGFLRDVTEQEQMERQLQHAQKMQAVGTLAGGVAHEFNNILMAIRGYTQLLRERASLDDAARGWLERIESSTERAAELTGNMLSFSRLEDGQVSPVDLNRLVGEVTELLRRTLPPDIELDLSMDPDLPPAMANPNHVEQVLLNLAVNARDAMAGGGRLTISTRLAAEGDAALRGQPWSGNGDYVEVSVSDTGSGIPPDNMERVFEPFFTTKEPGKGTGLGLSVAYSMIRNSGGQLLVHSREGEGSRFCFYLPAGGDQEPAGVLEVLPEPPEPGQGQRILLVDDEDTVREVAREALAGYGYRVDEACDGQQALDAYRAAGESGDAFDLVIMDLSMPVLSGREAIRGLLNMDPGARVVVSTGHADVSGDLGELEARTLGVLRKPFDLRSLALAVSRALGRPDA